MENFLEELNQYFKTQGIQKSNKGFEKVEEKEVQACINNLIKPVFKEIAVELNTYPNIKAEIYTSKKETTSAMESIELKIYSTSQIKFIYRPKFYSEKSEIYLIMQYGIPHNLYGEVKNLNNTEYKFIINEVDQEGIRFDFLNSFTKNCQFN